MAWNSDKEHGLQFEEQVPCKSEKWLLQLSVGAENKREGDVVCEESRAMQRSVGLNKKALNQGQCQAG